MSEPSSWDPHDAPTLPGTPAPSGAAPSDGGPAHPSRPYELLSPLGEGGMACVWRVRDPVFDREVAMKVARAECTRDPVLRQRFLNEARITSRLDHPAIPPTHDMGRTAEGLHFFTMKKVDGEGLDAVLERLEDPDRETRGEYTLTRLLQVFLKVCDAVAFAHERGVVHRDLKPANVMVGRFGQVFVMDWGLAKVLVPDGPEDRGERAQAPGPAPAPAEPADGKEGGDPLLSTDGTIFGTPYYMSPEQAHGDVDKVDRISDVYSLGAILYEILTLEPPVTGQTSTEVLAAVIQGKVAPPRQRAPGRGIPRELEALCLKALATKRQKRYPSVAALAADVRAYLERLPVSAYRYGIVERLARWVQRNPGIGFAGGVTLLMLALGGGAVGVLLARLETKAAEAARERAKAEERDARAREAALRAEAEALRAVHAEEKAARAVDSLAKGRAVSAVLRLADSELGDVLAALRRSHFSTLSRDERRAVGDRLRPRVEAVEGLIPADSASQAAWQAVRGWLLVLGGREDEAFDRFAESARTDPDVAYGPLFEGMVWLTEYLRGQILPAGSVGEDGVEFGEIPGETPQLAKLRSLFEEALARVRAVRVWGETASGEFEAVLEGFRAMQEEDLETAERGLTRGIGIAEMRWLAGELLLARAKVRYLRRDFAGALDDAGKVLALQPEDADVRFLLGELWHGMAVAEKFAGLDPRPAYGKAVEIFEDTLRLRPDDGFAWNLKGIARYGIGGAREARGEDPTEDYEAAIRDYSAALRLQPGHALTLFNRANAHKAVAAVLAKGRDPAPVVERYRLAAADFRAATSHLRGFTKALAARGDTLLTLGHVLARTRQDPRAVYEEGIRDLEEALRLDPSDAVGRQNLGTLYVSLGDAQAVRDQDPRETYRRATEVLAGGAGGPRSTLLAQSLGMALIRLGDREVKAGNDAADVFERAARAFDEAAALDPENWSPHASRGMALYRLGRFEEAVAAYDRALDLCGDPIPFVASQRAASLYALARNEALAAAAGDPAESEARAARAVESLRRAFEGGYADLERVTVDEALDGLRTREDFQALVAEWEESLKGR